MGNDIDRQTTKHDLMVIDRQYPDEKATQMDIDTDGLGTQIDGDTWMVTQTNNDSKCRRWQHQLTTKQAV